METAHQGYGAIRRMAEGGLIGTLKNKLFGPPETMTEKFARQDAERAAKTKPAEPKPTPAPPANTISGYAAGTAMKEREKAAGMKKGGAIKGKGTGTSDDVPIMASNGEFILKAKAVQKIGLPTLEALNAIADGEGDKPAKKVLDTAKQQVSEAGYTIPNSKYMHGGAIRKMATGGLVEDERRHALVAQIPAGGTAPAGGERVEGTDLSRNVGNTLSAIPGASPALGAIRTMANTASAARAASPAIGSVGQAVGQYAVPAVGAAALGVASQPATGQSEAVPRPIASPLPTAGPLASAIAPTSPAVASMSAQPGNAVTRTGNSYTGAPNITGDISIQNPDGSARKQGGVITAQNNQAAENMSARYTGSAPQQVGAIRGGGTVSSVDTSAGYAQDLRDLARIDAAKAEQAAGLQQQARFAQDQVLQQRFLGGNGAAGALLRRNAQNDQARAQNDLTKRGQDQQAGQQGATQRLAQQKFDVDAAGAKLDQQGKSAMLKAQEAVTSAKTPAERVAAEDTLKTLSLKFDKGAPPEQYAFAPGGQTVDPATGVAVTQPGVIFNKQTGEIKQQGAAKPAKSFEVGKTYTDAKGNKARWDGQNFVPTK